MAFPQGIDFRASAPFVSDPANCDNEIGTTANYPRTSAQGNTVGWEQAPSLPTRDRSSGVDARLAGMAGTFNSSGSAANYRLDLPSAGDYVIRMAIGDQAGGHANTVVELFDNVTSLGKIVNVGSTATDEFYDATGVKRTSDTDWVTNNATLTKTFASTILRVQIGDTSGSSDFTCIAHLFVQAAPSGATPGQPNVVDSAVARASSW